MTLDPRSRRRFLLHWAFLGAGLAVLALLIGLDAYFDRDRTAEIERDRLLAQARAVAINLSQQLSATDDALKATVRDMPQTVDGTSYTESTALRMRAMADSIPGVMTVFATDAVGTIVISSRAELIGQDLRDREYFRTARTLADPLTLYVTEPLHTRVRKQWAMILVRAILTADGKFNGLIAASLDQSYFRTLLSSTLYAPDGRASLVHGKGRIFLLVGAKPQGARAADAVEQRIGTSVAGPGSFFARHMETGYDENVLIGASHILQDRRMTALVTVRGEQEVLDVPLVILVNRDFAAVFAEWRRNAIERALAFLLIALVGAAAVKAYHRLELRSLARIEEAGRKVRQWAGAFEHSAQGMSIAIPETGRLLTCNSAFARMLGRTVAEIEGSAIPNLYDPREHARVMEKIAEADRTGRVRFESRMMRKDGSAVPVEVHLAAVRDETGKAIYRIASISDISNRVEAEERRRALEGQLSQSQKMEAVGRLTGGVAHDFNNLLQVISGGAQILARGLEEGEPRHRQVTMIKRAAERGAELTRRLLAFSRRQPLDPQAVDLAKAAVDLAPMFARTLPESIAIEAVTTGRPPTVTVDPGMLESALLNLVVNARDAMPDGGKLTIEVDTVTLGAADAARYKDVAPGDYGTIAVRDTGCGMAPEVLERAFEPFFTTKPVGKGTGLGLSTIYGFVKQSGGHVAIESAPGRGTVVRLFLPLGAEPAAELAAAAANDALPRGRERVLLVEDDAILREQTADFMAELGYSVTTAADGQEALARLAAAPPVDLLFTDVIMPGGINGRDLADRARALNPTLKVLYASGYADNLLDDRPRDGNFLPKPYNLRRLAEVLRIVLERPAA